MRKKQDIMWEQRTRWKLVEKWVTKYLNRYPTLFIDGYTKNKDIIFTRRLTRKSCMSQDIINNRFLEESVFAIADGYCVINLTKSIVRGSMYQVVNGKKYNLNEQLGLPENSSLESLVDAWALTIPEEGLQDFLHEFDRERLLNRFENGERHISF